MTWYQTAVGLVLLAYCGWRLVTLARGSGSAPPADRMAVLAIVGEALVVLAVARVFVDWTVVPALLWPVVCVALGVGCAAVLARCWAPLRWVRGDTSPQRTVRGALMAPYLAILLLVPGYVVVTLV